MLTLYVGSTYKKTTAPTGQDIITKNVFVLHGDNRTNLQDFQTPENDWGEMMITLPGVISRQKIYLPTEIEQVLIKYFNQYHKQNKPDFDCYAFTNMVKGVTSHPPSFHTRFWRTFPLRSKKSLGSIIFLFRKAENYPCHTAVYIGNGIYLSVHEAGGNIGFSSLRNMKQVYGARNVLVAKPR